jgi:hypothetical protein
MNIYTKQRSPCGFCRMDLNVENLFIGNIGGKESVEVAYAITKTTAIHP